MGSTGGWNRSAANQPTVKKGGAKEPSKVKGIVAGAVTVCALGALCLWMFSGGDDAPKAKVEKKSAKIKEVKPAAAPVYREEPEEKVVEVKKEKKYPTLREINQSPEQAVALEEKMLKEEPIPQDQTNRAFRTSLEQVMSWVFSCELGDDPPPIPEGITDFDLVHLQEILELKNPVRKTDSQEVAACREIVDFAKKELKSYIEKGGDPDSFLKYYHDELKQAAMERKVAEEQVMEVLEREPSLAGDYLAKVNARLKERGIKGIVIAERTLRRMGYEGMEELQPTTDEN